jgi:hypothetical protein
MQYTHELPTESGYYWLSQVSSNGKRYNASLVYVAFDITYKRKKHPMGVRFMRDDTMPKPYTHILTDLWAGPIVKPELPTE